MRLGAIPVASTARSLPGSDGLAREQRRLFLPIDDLPPVEFVRGDGSFLIDCDGRRYLDLGGGLGVNVLGYSSPVVRDAIHAQAAKLVHLGSEHLCEAPVHLAQELEAATGFDNFFFGNSGAEANEAALKIARNFHQAAGDGARSTILAFNGGFHGRTMFNISVAGNPAHCNGFGPLVPDIAHTDWDLEALERSVSERTAALMVETIQTRNGVRTISDEMIATINRLRRQYGFLVVVDEVQTGAMRCGTMLDHQRRGLDTDIVTLGKGLGGGLPIGVALTTQAIGGRMGRGQHGSTFGGGPLVCAVATAVLQAVREPAVAGRISDAGAMLQSALTARFGADAVTGCGLLVGLRLPPELAGRSGIVERLSLDNGLIVRTSGPHALRFTPPFIVSDTELADGIECLDEVIRSAMSG